MFPDGERKHAIDLYSAARMIRIFFHDFWCAVELFNYCEKNPSLEFSDDWKHTAARDCSMQLHHFYRAMENIQKLVGLCPSASARLDHSKRKLAFKLFHSNFPDYRLTRDAYGHTAEIMANSRVHSINSEEFRPDFKAGKISIFERLNGRSYENTKDGRYAKLEISNASVDCLHNILQMILGALTPVIVLPEDDYLRLKFVMHPELPVLN
jgi:hypothetical protein